MRLIATITCLAFAACVARPPRPVAASLPASTPASEPSSQPSPNLPYGLWFECKPGLLCSTRANVNALAEHLADRELGCQLRIIGLEEQARDSNDTAKAAESRASKSDLQAKLGLIGTISGGVAAIIAASVAAVKR